MQAQVYQQIRGRELTGLLLVVLVISSIPSLSCSGAESPESALDTPLGTWAESPSLRLPSRERVLSVAAPEKGLLTPQRLERMVLKRSVGLPEVGGHMPELAIWSPRDQESFLSSAVDLSSPEVETIGEGPVSAGGSGLDEPGSIRRRGPVQRISGGDLKSLEYAYRMALANLFNRRSGDEHLERSGASDSDFNFEEANPFDDHNPFEEALASAAETDVQGAREAPPAPVQDGVPPEPASQETPTPDSLRLAGLVRVDEDVEGPFSFLLYGEFTSQGEGGLFQAYRDEHRDFVLENSARFTPTTGLVLFEPGDQVLTLDLDQDGETDFVSTASDSEGILIRTYLGRGGLRFRRVGSMLAAGRVAGMAVFELTGDGLDDLAVIYEESSRLVVYQQVDHTFEYQKELVLPFTPGLLVASPGADIQDRRLHVFDSTLSDVISFTSDGAYGSSEPITDLLDPITLNGSDGSLVEMVAIEIGDRLTLVERTSDSVRLHGSFLTGYNPPLVIFGDYFDSGSRQLLLVP